MRNKTRIFASVFCGMILAACGDTSTPSSTKPADKPVKPAEVKVVEPETPAVAQPKPVVDRGAKVFKKCVTCHTLKEGEKHKVGPNLFGTIGAKAGQAEGFNYSKVMAESGLVWTDENLDAYLTRPAKFMPGNRMTYIGLRKAEDREAVIDYLKKETAPQ